MTLESLQALAMDQGACLLGVADMEKPVPIGPIDASEIPRLFPRAVSVAVRLSRAVLDGIDDRPTKLYFHHYRNVNMLLDRIGLLVANRIQEDGHDALPVPASQIVDWDTQKGHVSHKAVAERAGLGWIGRNNLLVTPRFGSQVRLVTVLTDAPLETGAPLDDGCGECRECLHVCPANAIKDDPDEFDHMACYEKLKEFRNMRYVGQFICGICVKVCPGRGDDGG